MRRNQSLFILYSIAFCSVLEPHHQYLLTAAVSEVTKINGHVTVTAGHMM